MLEIALLGTGGMMPLPNRWLTAMLGRYNGSSVLIDCGEGTQITLRRLGWSLKAIDYICFTHFHADHIAGLPGLLLSLGNSDRTEPVTLIGPKGLKRIVQGLLCIAPELPFQLKYIELDFKQAHDMMLGEIKVSVFPVDHGMPCFGYSLHVNRLAKFLPEKAKALGLPVNYWGMLQKGETVTYEEQLYTPDMVLGEARKGLKVTYCTDSRPVKNIAKFAKGADLFICEGMYGDDERQENAKKYKHMTIYDAAELAAMADVKELWLTHYSPAMTYPDKYSAKVREIFKNAHFGTDRKVKVLRFEDQEEQE